MQTFNLVQCFVAGSPLTLSSSLTTNLHLDYFKQGQQCPLKNPLPNLLLLCAKQQLITPRVDHELIILSHNPCRYGGRPMVVLTWAQLGESTFGLAHKGMSHSPWTNLNFFLKVKKCGKNC
jgi:hypothetical protein